MVIHTRKSNGITFPVHDVVPASSAFETWKTIDSLNHLLKFSDGLKNECDIEEVLYCSKYNSSSLAHVGYHPLIACLHLAFSQHRPLILSPDIIWQTILQGFAQHINNNSELLQEHLVSHKGKQNLSVEVEDIFVNSPESNWSAVIESLTDELCSRTTANSDGLLSDFSTTSCDEKLASSVALLDAYQAYYEYVVMCVCGIPQITLIGNVEDWRSIRLKVDRLDEIMANSASDLEWWLSSVRAIVDQFVRAANGDVDLNHWKDIYKRMDAYGGDIMNGWMLKLIPYLKNGLTGTFNVPNPLLFDDSWPEETDEYPHFMLRPVPNGISSASLPSGLSMVPFTLLGSEGNYAMQLLGGFIGVEQNDKSLALEPRVGWAVRRSPGLDSVLASLPSSCDLHTPLPPSEYESLSEKLLGLSRNMSGIVVPGDLLRFYRSYNGLRYKCLEILPFGDLEFLSAQNFDGSGENFLNRVEDDPGDCVWSTTASAPMIKFAMLSSGACFAIETGYENQRVYRVGEGAITLVADSFTIFVSNMETYLC